MTQRQLNVVLLGAPGRRQGHAGRAHRARFRPAAHLHRRHAARGGRPGHGARRWRPSGTWTPASWCRTRWSSASSASGSPRTMPRGGFLLDGFPRTLEQAGALDAMLAQSGRALTDVLLFDVPEEELVQRLAGRRTCRSCGKGYHWSSTRPSGRRLRRLRRRALPARRRQRSDGAQPARRVRATDGAARRVLRRPRPAGDRLRRRTHARRGVRRRPALARALLTPVIVRRSKAEVAKIAAAGAVLADCLDMLAAAVEPGVRPPSWTAWPRASSALAAASPRSSATGASRRPSAPRRTTWWCTASPACTPCARATSSASTWASRSTATSPTRPSRWPSAPSMRRRGA